MQPKIINWGLFILLSFIWGSSFILMKEGLKALSAYEVAAMRMLSAGLVLLPFAVKAFKQVTLRQSLVILLSGLLGSFIPAILFCVAETKISSSLAGMLNALTPLCVIITGIIFFQLKTKLKKIIGVVIGFAGMLFLFFSKGIKVEMEHLLFSGLILLATICYGFNVNIVNRNLKEVGSLNIASVAFVSLIIPSLILLGWNGFFQKSFSEQQVLLSVIAGSVLGIFGTAVASVLFYMLMKRAGPLFSSMVTYGIPFVAVFWGVMVNESVSVAELTGLVIILAGVYLANK